MHAPENIKRKERRIEAVCKENEVSFSRIPSDRIGDSFRAIVILAWLCQKFKDLHAAALK